MNEKQESNIYNREACYPHINQKMNTPKLNSQPMCKQLTQRTNDQVKKKENDYNNNQIIDH